MAQAKLFINGEPVTQKGFSAPKRAGSLDHWIRTVQKLYETELGPELSRKHGLGPILKQDLSTDEIRLSFGSGVQMVIDRKANGLGR